MAQEREYFDGEEQNCKDDFSRVWERVGSNGRVGLGLKGSLPFQGPRLNSGHVDKYAWGAGRSEVFRLPHFS